MTIKRKFHVSEVSSWSRYIQLKLYNFEVTQPKPWENSFIGTGRLNENPVIAK